jgi:hypothetical protein
MSDCDAKFRNFGQLNFILLTMRLSAAMLDYQVVTSGATMLSLSAALGNTLKIFS